MGTSQSERLDGDSVATLCNSTMNASFGGYSRGYGVARGAPLFG